jgi:hypothetical protein
MFKVLQQSSHDLITKILLERNNEATSISKSNQWEQKS